MTAAITKGACSCAIQTKTAVFESPARRKETLGDAGSLGVGELGGNGFGRCYACRVSQPLPLDEAIQELKRDPTHPVRVRVDEELTVEVRAVGEEIPSKTIGDLLREIGPWEGETGAALDALFTRQPGNRRVPDLP